MNDSICNFVPDNYGLMHICKFKTHKKFTKVKPMGVAVTSSKLVFDRFFIHYGIYYNKKTTFSECMGNPSKINLREFADPRTYSLLKFFFGGHISTTKGFS